VNNTENVGKPLFWFRPSKGASNLAAYSEEKSTYASKKDTSRAPIKTLLRRTREANSSLCFSDNNDSITTMEMAHTDIDIETKRTTTLEEEDDTEDLRGLCFLR